MSMPRRHIWQLGMHFNPSHGGVDRYFETLLGGFEAEQIASTAAAFGTPEFEGKFVQRVSLGPEGMSLAARSHAIRKFGEELINYSAPSLVATHFPLHTFFLRSSLRRTRTPHIAHFHGPWAEESRAEGQRPWVIAVKRWIEKRAVTGADHFITLSKAFRDLLADRFSVPLERISVIPAGIRPERFVPEGDRNFCREKMDWPEKRKLIFCVRRLVARMGLAELIQAFAAIAANFPEADLYLAGKGNLDGDLQRLVAKFGLYDRVRFLGYVPEADLPYMYRAADFSIVPSQLLEGFGLSALESLACGTAVLVTPVGGLPEVVSDLHPPLVLRGAGIDALAEGLSSALRNPELLPSSEACRVYASQRFSRDRMVRDVLAVYEGESEGWR